LIDQSNGVARNLLRRLSFRIRAAGALLRRRQKLGEFYRQLAVRLPETSARLAAVVAERLRQVVIFGDMRLPMPHLIDSFGVVTLGAAMDELQLLAAADAALYRARQAGRPAATRFRCNRTQTYRRAEK